MIKKPAIALLTMVLGSWCVYAVCTATSTPSSVSNDATVACNCAYTKYTTDPSGNNAAGLATCKTCAASTGGCNSTSEHYPSITEWYYSGIVVNNPPAASTCLIVDVGQNKGSHNNAAKYEYLAAGCGSGS